MSSQRGRRSTGFWQPFNVWWRKHLETHGERPKADDLKRWYKEEVQAAFPKDTPTYTMIRNHAKGLRDIASVKNYFRDYRARKRRAEASLDEEEEEERAGRQQAPAAGEEQATETEDEGPEPPEPREGPERGSSPAPERPGAGCGGAGSGISDASGSGSDSMSRDSGSPKSIKTAAVAAADGEAGAAASADYAPFRGGARPVRAAAKRAAAAVAACAAKESEQEREDREDEREVGSGGSKQKRGTEQGRAAGGGGEGHDSHRKQRRQEAEPDSESTGYMVTVTVRASGPQRKKQCNGGSSPTSSHSRPAKRAKGGSGLEAVVEGAMGEQKQQQQEEEPASEACRGKAAKGASAHQGRGSAASAAAMTVMVAAPRGEPPAKAAEACGDTSAGQGLGEGQAREQRQQQQRQEEQGEQGQRGPDQAQHGQQQGRVGNGGGSIVGKGTTANVEACGAAAAPTGATGQLPVDDSMRQGQGQGQGCRSRPSSQAGKEDGVDAGDGCMAGGPHDARAASAADGTAPGASTAEAPGPGTAAADAVPERDAEPGAGALAAEPARVSDAGDRGAALPSACERQDGGASHPPQDDRLGPGPQHVSPSGAAAARISIGQHGAPAAANARDSPNPGATSAVSRALSAATSLPPGWTPFAIQRPAPAGDPAHGPEPAPGPTARLSGSASACAHSSAAAVSRDATERAARSSGGGASNPAMKQEGGASACRKPQQTAQPPPLGAGSAAMQHGAEEGVVPGNVVAAAAAAAAASWMERCRGGSGELARASSDAAAGLQRGCGSPRGVTAPRGSHGGAGLPAWQELSGALSSPQGSLPLAICTGNTPSRLGPSHQLLTEGSSPRALSAQQPTARVLLPTSSPAGSPLKTCGPPPITTGFAPSRTAGRSGSGGSGASPLGMAPLPSGPVPVAGSGLCAPAADAVGPPPRSGTQATPFNCPAAAAAITAGAMYGSAGDAFAAAAPPLPSEAAGLRLGPLRAEVATCGPMGRSEVSPKDCNSSTSCSSWQQGLESGVRAGRGASGGGAGGGRDARAGSENLPAASPLCTSVPAAVAAAAVAPAGAVAGGAGAHAELQRLGSPARHPELQAADGGNVQQAGAAGPSVPVPSVSAAASGQLALQTHNSVPQAPTSDITGSSYTQYAHSHAHQQQQHMRDPTHSSAHSPAAGAPGPPSGQAPSSGVPMPPSGAPPAPLRRYPRWMPYPYPYSPASPHGTPAHPYPSAWPPPGYGYPYTHSPQGYVQQGSPSAAHAGPQVSDDSPNAAAAGPAAWAPYSSPYVPYRRRYVSAPSQPYQQGTPWSPYYHRYHPGSGAGAADAAAAAPGQHRTAHGSPASKAEGASTVPHGEGAYAQEQQQQLQNQHQQQQNLPTVGSLPTQLMHTSRLGPGSAPGSNGAVGSHGTGGASISPAAAGAYRQDDRTGRFGPAAPSPYAALGPSPREASPLTGGSPYSAGPNAFGARGDGLLAGYGQAHRCTPGGSAVGPVGPSEQSAYARGVIGGGVYGSQQQVGSARQQQLAQRSGADLEALGVVPGTEWLAPFAQSPAAGAMAQQQHHHHHHRQQRVSDQGVGAFDEGALDAFLGMCPAEELFGSGEGGDVGIFGP